MGHAQNLVLLENKDNLTEEVGKHWVGGRTALVVTATSYPNTLNLELQHRDNVWVVVNAQTLAANGIYSFDLPAGTYRMSLAGGTATNVYVTLNRIVY